MVPPLPPSNLLVPTQPNGSRTNEVEVVTKPGNSAKPRVSADECLDPTHPPASVGGQKNHQQGELNGKALRQIRFT